MSNKQNDTLREMWREHKDEEDVRYAYRTHKVEKNCSPEVLEECPYCGVMLDTRPHFHYFD
jgi:hypothetical protein